MKTKTIILLLVSLGILASCANNKTKRNDSANIPKPKLVVGIVIDQMRYDYLIRYADKYGNDGFKRLLNQGFSLENLHYNYVPTYTAVGHTSIYTGTTPFYHGIISNTWYDKFMKKYIYCVDDSSYTTVGTNGDYGKKSPYRMKSTTVLDQLKLAQNMQGKTIGIALKDRSAILPAGHIADAAYWFEGGDAGQWISSSYYMNELPNWVQEFNKSGKAEEYLSKPWECLYDISTYTESIEDDNDFENTFEGEERPVFPHDIPALRSKNGNFSILKAIPAGNTITVDFAKAAIIGEKLGQGKYTDFLAVSFSSPDYIGHQYGVAAKETEDNYLRLDKDIADFLKFLDKTVGQGEYTVFLTADHAAVHVPSYLQSLKVPAGYFNYRKFKEYVNQITLKYFKTSGIVENISNFQIFLNKSKMDALKLDYNKVTEKISQEIINYNNIYKSLTANTLQKTDFSDGILNLLQNGYNQKLSGDVIFIFNPYVIPSSNPKGTTHGSGYNYDTHVPALFYGKGVKQGVSKKKYNITDIAPTIANILDIEFTNANSGKVIEEVLE